MRHKPKRVRWRQRARHLNRAYEVWGMEFAFLADRPTALSTVSGWYDQQWGHRLPHSETSYASRLNGYLNRDRLPLLLLALQNDVVVGAAQLKLREMEMFPHREHWLGGVFVERTHRGNKIGSRLCDAVAGTARRLGVETLYLQTEFLDGGLYARLGWQRLEQIQAKGIEVLVMAKSIGSA